MLWYVCGSCGTPLYINTYWSYLIVIIDHVNLFQSKLTEALECIEKTHLTPSRCNIILLQNNHSQLGINGVAAKYRWRYVKEIIYLYLHLLSSWVCKCWRSCGCMPWSAANRVCTEESFIMLRPRAELLFILLTKTSMLLDKSLINCSRPSTSSSSSSADAPTAPFCSAW